jgi:hypothetical protein
MLASKKHCYLLGLHRAFGHRAMDASGITILAFHLLRLLRYNCHEADIDVRLAASPTRW